MQLSYNRRWKSLVYANTSFCARVPSRAPAREAPFLKAGKQNRTPILIYSVKSQFFAILLNLQATGGTGIKWGKQWGNIPCTE